MKVKIPKANRIDLVYQLAELVNNSWMKEKCSPKTEVATQVFWVRARPITKEVSSQMLTMIKSTAFWRM